MSYTASLLIQAASGMDLPRNANKSSGELLQQMLVGELFLGKESVRIIARMRGGSDFIKSYRLEIIKAALRYHYIGLFEKDSEGKTLLDYATNSANQYLVEFLNKEISQMKPGANPGKLPLDETTQPPAKRMKTEDVQSASCISTSNKRPSFFSSLIEKIERLELDSASDVKKRSSSFPLPDAKIAKLDEKSPSPSPKL